MTFFSIKDITLKIPGRDRPILQNLSFDIHRNDFIIVLGSNGSGKSSVLKTINGLLLPSQGTIHLEGKNILPDPVHIRAQSIITLSQDLFSSTFSNLTLLENCLIAMHRHKKPSLSWIKTKEKKQIIHHLEQFHPSLNSKLDQKTSNLSGGEKQALALAMAFWHRPKLLLLDEHTSALDPATGQKIMELTHKMATQNNIPTLMVTHKLEHALAFGNRLIALCQGQILCDLSQKEKATLTHDKLLRIYTS